MTAHYVTAIDPAATNSSHASALRFVGRDRRVLEVGCSTGFMTEHLVAAGNEVVGIEIDPEGAEQARRHADTVHVADLDLVRLTDLVDGPFDVVLFGDVLEHLRRPVEALTDARTLLADGGHVVVSIPNAAHADMRLMLLEGRWEYQDRGLLDRTHVHFFTREGLRASLAEAGLVATAVERVTNSMFATNLPVTPELHSEATRRFVLADPEAETFQFVVAASPGGGDDALAGPEPDFASVTAEIDALQREVADLRWATGEHERHIAALQAEVEAWRGSTLARVTGPLRTVWGAVRRRRRA